MSEPFEHDADCPDCGGFIFRPGPRGGVAQNIECVGCDARFNVMRFDASYMRGLLPPKLWQRIPSERDGGGAWREDMFPKVLQ